MKAIRGKNVGWRALLVEDDIVARKMILKSLEGISLEVECAESGQGAMDRLRQDDFDLVLLDIGLPDISGMQLCSELRNDQRHRDLLIMFVSGQEGIGNKVQGFSLGADDYVSKPFDPRELKARVESKLKRFKSKVPAGPLFSRGNLKLDLPMQQAYLFKEGRQTDLFLTPSEFRLLYYFISHENEILSREQLLEALWEKQGVHVLKRTIDRHVATLRRKIGTQTHKIQTVSKSGYRFFWSMV